MYQKLDYRVASTSPLHGIIAIENVISDDLPAEYFFLLLHKSVSMYMNMLSVFYDN